MSNLSSAEWASWVQAVGSVVAIFAAAGIAIFSARLQHRNALALHEKEIRTGKIELSKTLLVIAENSSKAMKHIAGQLHDRESVHKAAEGELPCDIGEINRMDAYLEGIPLHTVPHSMVTSTMVLGSTVRQFKEKVEVTLKLHRKMDANMFGDFFQTLGEMQSSTEDTCKQIESEVRSLETVQ